MLLVGERFAQLLLMALSVSLALGWEMGVRFVMPVSKSGVLCAAQGLQIPRGDGWGRK